MTSLTPPVPTVEIQGNRIKLVDNGDGTFSLATSTPAASPSVVRPGSPTTEAWLSAPISFSASGDNTIVAGVSGQTIRIMRMFFVNTDGATPTNIQIKDSTPNNFSGAFLLNSGGSFNGAGTGEPLFVTASGKGFVLNSSAAVQISGTVWYTQS